jgi:bacillithiol synthase
VHQFTVRGRHDAPPLPLNERVWGPDIERVTRDFAAALPATEFSSDIAAHVRGAYTPSMTVSASFTATMELLLQDRRVALVNSAHPLVRRAAAPVLLREIECAQAHYGALERQTSRLADAGFAPQVELAEGAANIMLLSEHGRDRLVQDGAGWRTRRQKQAITQDALLALIRSEPNRFSPNVLLRPVVESALFPTLAYVAGPGELSYFAQTACLFKEHGIAQPVIIARPSVTLVEARVRRLLDRLKLQPADVRRPFQELVTDVIRREVPPEATAALERIRAVLRDAYGELMDITEAIDPTLRGPLTAARNWSTVRANDAEKRIVRHLKRRNAILVEQLRKAHAGLYPDGAPQERVLSPLPLVARHGPQLIAGIEAAINAGFERVASWDGPAC